MRATNRVVGALALATAALALAGCPRFTNGGFACGASNACPPGYHCAADKRCWKLNQNPDLSATVNNNSDGSVNGNVDLYGVAPGADLYGVAPGADLAGTSTGPDMAPSLGLGQLCGAKGDCISGNCVDGVCCDMPCSNACMSCNQSTSLGKCTPVAPGNTPSHGTCGPDMPTSCGRNGKCDGAGNCQKYDASTACGSSTCVGTTFTGAPHCDSMGNCVKPTATSCGVYNCDTNGACFTSCTGSGFTDGHCSAASPGCSSNSCGKRSNGQPCPNGGSDCTSGNCVDTACCASTAAMCKDCQTCNGTNPGTCTNVVSGDPHSVCPTNATLCQAGGCSNGSCAPSPSGTICGSTCMSTDMFAVAKCNGTTLGCPAAGAPTPCAGNLICADGSSCKPSCSVDADCLSGYWCNGSNCQAKGTACTSLPCTGSHCTPSALCNGSTCDQCQSSGCNVFYPDTDSDTYGDATAPTYFCGTMPPSGYVNDNTDCCDHDGNMHPNQPGWFYSASASCNGSWNYNCTFDQFGNPIIEEQYAPGKGSCVSGGNCGCTTPFTCTTNVGWVNGDPGCGNTAAWLTSCNKAGLCNCTCEGSATKCGASCTGVYGSISQQQGCR